MLKAYVDLMSQPSRALYMFLKYTKIPHVIQPVALRKGAHLQPEFAKINPFKVVPVIDDGGFLLPESVAILQYLCRKHNITDLYPTDPEQRARIEAFTHWQHLNLSVAILQYLCRKHNITDLYPTDLEHRAKIEAFTHWQHLNLRFGGGGLFQSLLIQPSLTGNPIDQMKVDLSAKVFKASLKKLENIYLKETPFISSETMSIADLLGVCELMQPKLGLAMSDITDDYPKVGKWSERVRETIGAELFDEAHKVIRFAGEKVAAMKIPTPKL